MHDVPSTGIDESNLAELRKNGEASSVVKSKTKGPKPKRRRDRRNSGESWEMFEPFFLDSTGFGQGLHWKNGVSFASLEDYFVPQN